MGHPCWARLRIGGDIPKSLVPELKDLLEKEFSGMYCADIEEEFEEGVVFSAADSEANYGHFSSLEEFLINHRIHFDVRCDSDPEWDFGLWQYRGEEPPEDAVDEDGNIKDVTSMMDLRTTDNFGWLVWRWEEIEKALGKVQDMAALAVKTGKKMNTEIANSLLKKELGVDTVPELQPLRFVEDKEP